jgi:formamidopyrimidine-DNA glycosylase
MPELPEVETVRRRLEACLPGLVVDEVTVNDVLVSNQTAADLRAAFVGRRVVALRRRGKYLIIELEGMLLVVHLRMTGRLLLAPEPGRRAPRLVVRLRPDTELLFYDTRRFGRVWAVPAADENAFFAALGPEPFSDAFTSVYLRRALEGRTTPLKSFLLDQRRIAGVGNIYADEALFGARLHPLRTAGTLGPGEIQRLHDALLETLQLGIEHAGASIDTFVDPDGASGDFQAMLNVYGRTGQACRVCGTPIERVELGGRGTHFCPACQTLPRGKRLAAGGREALARERAARLRRRARVARRR